MKKLQHIISIALLSTLGFAFAGPVAPPAPVPTGPEVYIFGYGGVNWIGDFENDGTGSATGLSVDFDGETGWGAGGGIGLRSDFLGGSRLEVEGLYRSNDADTVLVNGSNLFNANGDFDTTGVQVNFLKELGSIGGLVPYAGIGIGWAQNDVDVNYNNGLVTINDDGSGFAWQAIAGLELPLSQKLRLYTEYRFLSLTNGELDRFTPGGLTPVEIDVLYQHSVFVGVRVFF